MTVSIIFSGAADGNISSSSATYANARAGTGTLNANTTDVGILVGQESGGGVSTCYEGFVLFDTAFIGAAATVSAITLSLWLVSDASVSADFTINARQKTWGATLTTADYVAGASLTGQTLVASISTSGIGATGAYKTLTSQAAFLTITNLKTGSVEIILCSSRQEGNNAPAGEEYVYVSSADESGTGQDPFITVTYTLPAAKPNFQVKSNRIWRRR